MLFLRMCLYFFSAIKTLFLSIISDISHTNIKYIEIIGLASLGHLWNVFMWFIVTLHYRYGHFIRDLCSIRDYSSTCILTSTELSFLIEYICTIKGIYLFFQTFIIIICHIIINVYIALSCIFLKRIKIIIIIIIIIIIFFFLHFF